MVVDDGFIIVNDDIVEIKLRDGPVKQGTRTYSFTYGEEIQTNVSVYKNQKGMIKKVPSLATSASLNITGHQKTCSKSEKIKRRNCKNPAVWSLATVAILIII